MTEIKTEDLEQVSGGLGTIMTLRGTVVYYPTNGDDTITIENNDGQFTTFRAVRSRQGSHYRDRIWFSNAVGEQPEIEVRADSREEWINRHHMIVYRA